MLLKLTALSTALALITLSACSTADNLLPLPHAKSQLSLTSPHNTIELEELELPGYAEQEEVMLKMSNGLILAVPNLLWADIPKRSTTLQVAKHLDQILTSTTIASKPWPFSTQADRAITVQIEDIIAHENGTFALNGRYTIGGFDDDTPIKKRNITIKTQWIVGNYASLAQAQVGALLQLSEHIARTLSH